MISENRILFGIRIRSKKGICHTLEVSDVFSVHCEVRAVRVVQSLNNAKCRFLQGQDE